MSPPNEFDKVYATTQSVYERQASQFDKDRTRDGRESEWLELFAESIPAGGQILDLGCGTGEPIAAWFISRGFQITGLDYSEPMLEIARTRFPNASWILGDMREMALDEKFDGIISWHGSFHLTEEEQRRLLPKLAKLLKPSGTLMLTTGPDAGEITGTVAGETVYHASLSPSEYCGLLTANGCTDIQHFHATEMGGPFILMARKKTL